MTSAARLLRQSNWRREDWYLADESRARAIRPEVPQYEPHFLEDWMEQVLRHPDMPNGAKVMAIAIGLNAMARLYDPTCRLLADQTSLSQRVVERYKPELRRLGFLNWSSTKGRTSNVYYLTLPAAAPEVHSVCGVLVGPA